MSPGMGFDFSAIRQSTQLETLMITQKITPAMVRRLRADVRQGFLKWIDDHPDLPPTKDIAGISARGRGLSFSVYKENEKGERYFDDAIGTDGGVAMDHFFVEVDMPFHIRLLVFDLQKDWVPLVPEDEDTCPA